jgi:hypothetical protein
MENEQELEEIYNCKYIKPYSKYWDKPYRCTNKEFCGEKRIIQGMPFCSFSVKEYLADNK